MQKNSDNDGTTFWIELVLKYSVQRFAMQCSSLTAFQDKSVWQTFYQIETE